MTRAELAIAIVSIAGSLVLLCVAVAREPTTPAAARAVCVARGGRVEVYGAHGADRSLAWRCIRVPAGFP